MSLLDLLDDLRKSAFLGQKIYLDGCRFDLVLNRFFPVPAGCVCDSLPMRAGGCAANPGPQALCPYNLRNGLQILIP
jgi:hypothetical protein